MSYTIYGINGPVVTVRGGRGLAMMDMVRVGDMGLIGEVVGVEGDTTTVQVYEDTAGLIPGQPVTSLGAPMSITLVSSTTSLTASPGPSRSWRSGAVPSWTVGWTSPPWTRTAGGRPPFWSGRETNSKRETAMPSVLRPPSLLTAVWCPPGSPAE